MVVIQLIACSTFPGKHTNLVGSQLCLWARQSGHTGVCRAGCQAWMQDLHFLVLARLLVEGSPPFRHLACPHSQAQRYPGSEEQLWRTKEEQQQAGQTRPQQPKKPMCLPGKLQLTISCISTTSGCLL